MQISVTREEELRRSELSGLTSAAAEEGHEFVERLVRDWESGDNRFDRAGEALFVARHGTEIVGVCGLNRDPYADDPTVGRLRRLYVLPRVRKRGVGRGLTRLALRYAKDTFRSVRLRAGTDEAFPFYATLGFTSAPGPMVTHVLSW